MTAPEELAPETDEQTITRLAADLAEARQQVDELESEHELTAALSVLDAVRDVALSTEAPGALRATDALTRLVFLVFNRPVPQPIMREGGMVDAIFGKQVRAPRGCDR